MAQSPEVSLGETCPPVMETSEQKLNYYYFDILKQGMRWREQQQKHVAEHEMPKSYVKEDLLQVQQNKQVLDNYYQNELKQGSFWNYSTVVEDQNVLERQVPQTYQSFNEVGPKQDSCYEQMMPVSFAKDSTVTQQNDYHQMYDNDYYSNSVKQCSVWKDRTFQEAKQQQSQELSETQIDYNKTNPKLDQYCDQENTESRVLENYIESQRDCRQENDIFHNGSLNQRSFGKDKSVQEDNVMEPDLPQTQMNNCDNIDPKQVNHFDQQIQESYDKENSLEAQGDEPKQEELDSRLLEPICLVKEEPLRDDSDQDTNIVDPSELVTCVVKEVQKENDQQSRKMNAKGCEEKEETNEAQQKSQNNTNNAGESINKFPRHKKHPIWDKCYKCEKCNFRTARNDYLVVHMKLHKALKMFVCTHCDYKTDRISILTMHTRTHTGDKPYACKQCDYKTTLRGNLKKHMLTHNTDVKPFVCSYCGYKTARNFHLKAHIRKHTGDRPYACNQCEFRTSHSGDLKVHKRTHSGETPFICKDCDYKTYRSSHLTAHMKTHSGIKPHVCTYCDFKTARRNILIEHMRGHTGDKPYVCDVCGYKTSRKSNLSVHMKTHSDDKPFICNLCDYRGAHNFHLTAHVKRMHLRVTLD